MREQEEAAFSPYERDYPALTKKLAFWTKIAAFVGMTGILGVAASIITSGILSYKAVQAATQQLREARYITATNWMLDLDKIYMDHPWMAPYFENGKPIAQSAKNYGRVAATAEFIMDAMDSMLDTHKDKWPDEGFRNWAEDTFSRSPILRSVLEERRRWYCKHLYPKYFEWSKKSVSSAPQQPRCN